MVLALFRIQEVKQAEIKPVSEMKTELGENLKNMKHFKDLKTIKYF